MEFNCYLEASWGWIQSNFEGIVAVLALIATGAQAYLTRKHNRVSVRPFFMASTGFLEENNRRITYKAELTNGGLGPAFIKEFFILINDVEYKNSRPNEVKELIEKEVGKPAETWYAWICEKDSVIRPQEVREIAKFTFVFDAQQEMQAMTEKLYGSVHLLVRYESAYGESFVYDSREHLFQRVSWLKRLAYWRGK